jgi:ribosomal protein S18 acetylase RimI-like enzyme
MLRDGYPAEIAARWGKYMIDLKPLLDDSSVRELLSLCVGFPTPAKLEAICEQYHTDDARSLLGIEENGHIIACIGFRLEALHHAVINCIAVAPSHRCQGIGETLVQGISTQFQLQSLTAETDSDAVGFYRNCGFEITSLGEVYPGTERFRCVLRPDA